MWCVHRGQKKALSVLPCQSLPVFFEAGSVLEPQGAFPARLAANKPSSLTVPTLLAAGVKCITRNPICFVDAGIRISVLIR